MASNSELDIPQALIARYTQIGTATKDDALFCSRAGVTPDDYEEALSALGGDDDAPITLYVHIPFCAVRCLNCDNNTSITHDSAEIDRYLDALEREVVQMTNAQGKGKRVQQLHLGGGSPNYLSDHQLVRLMTILDRHFQIDADTETSLDANPKNTSPNQLALLHGLGFRRITFGLRDLDPAVQLAIGRLSSVDMIRDVFDNARDVGFQTVSTDVMYGLPRQNAASIERTVENLLELGPDRISCYAFTRRAAQRTHQRAIDPCEMPSLADKLALFNGIVEGLTSDYTWIGLDSFAKQGDQLCQAQAEQRLRKNWIGYTQQAQSDLYGFGTNAISDLQGFCVQNHLQISPWEEAVRDGTFPIRGGVKLSQRDRQRREAMTQLMCNMELRDYAALFDHDEQTPSAWSAYARDGLLSITSESMSITPQGRYMLHQLWSGPMASLANG
ncbi:MAG: oxygen-independent coproporphyrinogen III oxidase [Sedimenticolaceae bacterium]